MKDLRFQLVIAAMLIVIAKHLIHGIELLKNVSLSTAFGTSTFIAPSIRRSDLRGLLCENVQHVRLTFTITSTGILSRCLPNFRVSFNNVRSRSVFVILHMVFVIALTVR